MKKAFSTSWKGSRQPRKQRKYAANAPLHIKHKFMSANLAKELRKAHGKRNIEIRKNDSVRIMRGEFKGKKGKSDRASLKRGKVSIQRIQRAKRDGTKVSIWFMPSNLQITELNLDDKERMGRGKQAKAAALPQNTESKSPVKTKEKTKDKEKNAPK